jgi:hypothetical protein
MLHNPTSANLQSIFQLDPLFQSIQSIVGHYQTSSSSQGCFQYDTPSLPFQPPTSQYQPPMPYFQAPSMPMVFPPAESHRFEPYPTQGRKSKAENSNTVGSQVFGAGAAGGSTVCAICLGIHPQVVKCRSTSLWNGSPARCYRDERNKLTNPNGTNICLGFQLSGGCKGRAGPKHFHECSGCGATDHGASRCPIRARA